MVFGVANHRSIAWAIARAWNQAGARVALSYQGERLQDTVQSLAQQLVPEAFTFPCDVTSDQQIDQAFSTLQQQFGTLHLLLHSIAFAPRRALDGKFIDLQRDDFHVAMDVSVYSLIALAQRAYPLMSQGGAILTLTYYGSVKVVPNYNVMGVAKAALESAVRYLAADLGPQHIRVNAISAGPVKTLAARGIAGFTKMLEHYEQKTPLRRNITPEELGATAVFLASDGAAAITGQTIYVDCGYEIMGM